VAAAESAPAQAPPPPQATTLAQNAPKDATPTAAAAIPDQTQLLQTMARDLASLERSIEQLKANQQQMASDNSKAIEELKASQEEIKRTLAKVTEQGPPRTSQPPTQPAPALRKPERTPQARARPRYPREWMYDDW
jgi:transposase